MIVLPLSFLIQKKKTTRATQKRKRKKRELGPLRSESALGRDVGLGMMVVVVRVSDASKREPRFSLNGRYVVVCMQSTIILMHH
jgi:hypothetical protein